jgi:hypothetical protein
MGAAENKICGRGYSGNMRRNAGNNTIETTRLNGGARRKEGRGSEGAGSLAAHIRHQLRICEGTIRVGWRQDLRVPRMGSVPTWDARLRREGLWRPAKRPISSATTA